MKLTQKQINQIYGMVGNLMDILNGYRHDDGSEPDVTGDAVYNELNAAFGSLQAVIENDHLLINILV